MTTSCPECGNHFHSLEAQEAQTRISDLETQVRLLNNRASTYVDKLTDYEEEIKSLREQCAKLQEEKDNDVPLGLLQAQAQSQPQSRSGEKEQNRESLPPPPPEKDSVPERNTNRQSMSRLSNLTSYLPGRRKDPEGVPPLPPITPAYSQSTPNLQTPATDYFASPSPRQTQSLTLIGLQTKLENERQLREEAEKNLTDAQSELEELTAQLFGQANEMVAQERKARAELEERVKLLETRDGEKRRRLERLEVAVARIERVRRIVVEHEKELEGVREREKEVEVVIQRRFPEKVGRATAAR